MSEQTDLFPADHFSMIMTNVAAIMKASEAAVLLSCGITRPRNPKTADGGSAKILPFGETRRSRRRRERAR
jgi:hypothetical protein